MAGATWNLIQLIKDAGNTAAAGQGMRTHVAAALSETAAGDSVRQHTLTDWTGWGCSPAGVTADGSTPTLAFDTGQVFNLTTNINGGTKRMNVTRQGNVLVLGAVVVGTGGSVTLAGGSPTTNVNSSANVSAYVTIVSPYGGSLGLSSAGAWNWTNSFPDTTASSGYDNTNHNTEDARSGPPSNPMRLHFYAVQTGGAPTGTAEVDFTLYFTNPNTGTGAFNGDLSTVFKALMNVRPINVNDVEIEWWTRQQSGVNAGAAPATDGTAPYSYNTTGGAVRVANGFGASYKWDQNNPPANAPADATYDGGNTSGVGSNLTLYMQYRLGGTGNWNRNATPYQTLTDTRLA